MPKHVCFVRSLFFHNWPTFHENRPNTYILSSVVQATLNIIYISYCVKHFLQIKEAVKNYISCISFLINSFNERNNGVASLLFFLNPN